MTSLISDFEGTEISNGKNQENKNKVQRSISRFLVMMTLAADKYRILIKFYDCDAGAHPGETGPAGHTNSLGGVFERTKFENPNWHGSDLLIVC